MEQLMNYDRLKKQLVVHEGLETKLYHCSMGHPTIGVGRNLSVGISEDEAMYLLDNDIKSVVAQCQATFSWFDGLNDVRKEAIVNLVFNMGLNTFCKFKKTIGYIEKGLFELAGTELLDSNYARQVGQRSVEVANMIADGDGK
jgi:lysozyme